MKLVGVALLSQAVAAVEWWQTAQEGGFRLSHMPPLSFEQRRASSDATTVRLDPTQKFQTILGFGGAFTQSAATVWQQLSSNLKAEVIEAYFGASGIGYTTGRIPIHSCDFSPDVYTFDDKAGDYNLTYFDDAVKHDANRTIPLIKAALKASATPPRLFGSPWSPPAWMKSNGNMLGGGSLLQEAAPAWADYFSRWITAYQAQGVPLWGVTVQNEPEASQPWESCVYSAESEAAFVAEHLGPKLKAEHPDVKILGFDHNKDHIVHWADALMSTAGQYVDGIAFHWYSGSCFENVAAVAAAHQDKLLLPTEACYELTHLDQDEKNDDWLANGTWARGEGYAHDILGDLNAGASGWTDWNLMLDQEGGPNHVGNFCDAAILADTRVVGGKLYYHPQFWYLGHFSKFVLPDSRRIGVTVGDAPSVGSDCKGWPAYGLCPAGGLEATAFLRPDGQLAVVVMNCADAAAQLALELADDAIAYNTVPAHSIQTYVFAVSA